MRSCVFTDEMKSVYAIMSYGYNLIFFNFKKMWSKKRKDKYVIDRLFFSDFSKTIPLFLNKAI